MYIILIDYYSAVSFNHLSYDF